MTIPVPPSPSAAALERLLRRLPADRLLDLADTLRRAAFAFDHGRPDSGMTEIATAAELLDAPGGHDTPDSASTCAIGLLDRAAHDLRQGWTAAAYDCAARAVRLIETLTTTREIRHVD